MKYPDLVYILSLGGSSDQAHGIAGRRYPGCDVVNLPKRQLREGGWKRQLQQLRKMKGQAFIVSAESIENLQEPLLLKLTSILHRCKETVIADSSGRVEILERWAIWKLLPVAIFAAAADVTVVALSWMALLFLRFRVRVPMGFAKPNATDVAFLYPFPKGGEQTGGAMSHIAGFLNGLARCSARCEIFTGRPLPNSRFPQHELSNRRQFYLLRECLALSYNWYFARNAAKELAHRVPLFIYQRHGRFAVAGALLSRRVRRPLVLEYNGSEVWISKHWDPAKFVPWLSVCEEISLAAATLITVVSEALKNELVERGIPEEKILVNPNGVDPDLFYPHCGGSELRRQLRIASDHVVVGFIGSFSYWHGISVLQEAVQLLLREQESGGLLPQLRFLLVGDGLLQAEIRSALEQYSDRGWVIFPGQVPHEQAPRYLDAADILVSPHVPMLDGSPFFGSPTKLFEYMAMRKAIVASDLDQLAHVLTHQQTAWLVRPGNATELAHAIRLLASNAEMRNYLGNNAREAALSDHTWQQNAARVLSRFAATEAPSPMAWARDINVTE